MTKLDLFPNDATNARQKKYWIMCPHVQFSSLKGYGLVVFSYQFICLFVYLFICICRQQRGTPLTGEVIEILILIFD